ncbi:hypothetical protein EVAR_5675_1 [Eumeta japonica]|uniref:Uncharacterized protein n=1 Tax=Eumeta variegata TaxID=151549 RepID=A0A4C1T898_EUMVA|nr:hypothetical protein EVAR_5675_1 [Eumeta japonica]
MVNVTFMRCTNINGYVLKSLHRLSQPAKAFAKRTSFGYLFRRAARRGTATKSVTSVISPRAARLQLAAGHGHPSRQKRGLGPSPGARHNLESRFAVTI